MQHMERIAATGLAGLVAVMTVNCADSKQPTAPTPVAEALTIAGARNLTEGETAGLTATLQYTTGATETFTNRVAWSSEDSRVASVNNQGIVTAVGPGDVRIRATLNAVSSTASIRVTRAGVIAGRVHESRPTEHVPIAGATVTVVDSLGSRQAAVTDGAGKFTLRLSPGPARITVEAPGYETSEHPAEIGERDRSAPGKGSPVR